MINGYETVSFVDYDWKGDQGKELSKDNQEGLSILENSSLKTDLFSLQGGIFNLDGDLITKKSISFVIKKLMLMKNQYSELLIKK